MDKIKVIQYGLGPIGSAIARYASSNERVELVGGIDIDPNKVDRDLGEVIELDRQLGIQVKDKLSTLLEDTSGDIVIHATSSYFSLFKPQIIEIIEAGLDVISTAEELSFPWLAHPEDAQEIDEIARKHGKTVLGVGVNPGFLMDSLPLNLTAICQEINHIRVSRIINASKRRGPFQAKIGSGMTVDEFNRKMAEGRMGHVGLVESIGMLFDTLGRKLVRYESDVEPVVTDHPIETGYFKVDPGRVRGLKQTARGFSDSGEFVELVFIAALDEEDEADTIEISGVPNLKVRLEGTNGDIATAAIAVNAVRRVIKAPPGLITMRDLPIVTR